MKLICLSGKNDFSKSFVSNELDLHVAIALSSCSRSITPTGPFPIDMSKAGDTVDVDITVREYRGYIFYAYVCYKGEADFKRVLEIVGDGAYYKDGSYINPGVITPIQLAVRDSNGREIYNRILDVKGSLQHTWTDKYDGCLGRRITAVALRPGEYHVQVQIVNSTPQFAGRQSHIEIQWMYNTVPMKE